MTAEDRLLVSRERNFSAHHMLLGAARAALEDAEQRKPGWFYAELIAITMSALAIEALCNAIGERVLETWKDFESATPMAKLRVLSSVLELHYDVNAEPWATAKWLHKFRNEVAHAKPEFVKESYVWRRTEYEKREREEPKSRLEKRITRGNARRAVNQTVKLKDLLCEEIPVEKSFGLFSDSWSGSASPAKEA